GRAVARRSHMDDLRPVRGRGPMVGHSAEYRGLMVAAGDSPGLDAVRGRCRCLERHCRWIDVGDRTNIRADMGQPYLVCWLRAGWTAPRYVSVAHAAAPCRVCDLVAGVHLGWAGRWLRCRTCCSPRLRKCDSGLPGHRLSVGESADDGGSGG